MSILSLPNELFLLIANDLDREKDVYALIRTNRRFASLFTPRLHVLALQDKDGISALYWAVSRGHRELARWLSSQDIDLDFKERRFYCQTPLHEAVIRRDLPIIKLLIESGADVSLPDSWQYTVLHHAACEFRNEEVVRLLLEKGADVAARGDDGESVFDKVIHQQGSWAINNIEPCEETIRLLLRHAIAVRARIDLPPYLVFAVAKDGYEDLVELVLKGWGDMSNVCGSSYAEIMLRGAALGGHTSIVLLLLDRGTYIHAQDESGKTALHFAFRCLGSVQTVYQMASLLIKHGADPTIKDVGQRTARTMALYRYGDHSLLVSLLCSPYSNTCKQMISPRKQQQVIDHHPWYVLSAEAWRHTIFLSVVVSIFLVYVMVS